jgi:hypothetical protein
VKLHVFDSDTDLTYLRILLSGFRIGLGVAVSFLPSGQVEPKCEHMVFRKSRTNLCQFHQASQQFDRPAQEFPNVRGAAVV